MITGTEGNDSLDNTSENPATINALGGDDTITIDTDYHFSEFVDTKVTVDGGSGFDTLYLQTVGRGLIGFGTNSISWYESRYHHGSVSFANVERLVVSGIWGSEIRVSTGDTHDELSIYGSAPTAHPIVKLDTLGGDDIVKLSGLQNGSDINLGAGNDLLDLSGTTLTDNQNFFGDGGDGHDKLIGSKSGDRFQGGAGDDNLDGREGADMLTGGTGNDVYIVDSLDTVTELAGEGFDQVYTRTDFTLAAGASIELFGTADYTLTHTLTMIGNEINNAITGNNGSNSLYGGAGDDYLTGLAGNDLFDGGTGADFTVGGLGDDIFYVDDAADIVLENAGEGYDAIYTVSSIGIRAGVAVERIGTMNYLATTAIYLTGNEFGQDLIGNNGNNQISGLGGNDYLVGLGGDDFLNGGTGFDVLEGGAGNDIYYVDAGDLVRESVGEGNDAVYASDFFTLGAGSEVEILATTDYTSTAGFSLHGNEFNNTITGNNGWNLLSGGAGSDVIYGLEGRDTIVGGAGQDFLSGGAGADWYRFSAASDTLASAPDTILDFQSGADLIDLSGIDAKVGGGDDAFTAIGSNAFTGSAGELRWEAVGSQTFVYGDTDGDKIADIQIVVNSTMVVVSDFGF